MGNTCVKSAQDHEDDRDHFMYEIESNVKKGMTIHQSKIPLGSINKDEFNAFQLNGLVVRAKVIDVYDGDTCDIGFCLYGVPLCRRLRLRWINTEEIRQSKKLEEEERNRRKQNALNAKYRLVELVTGNKPANNEDCEKFIENNGKEIWVKFYNDDSFSRTVSEIYLNDEMTISVHETMIKEGHSELFGKYENASDLNEIKIKLNIY